MSKNTISVFKFMEIFPNEQKAMDWFEQKRWAGKPTCTYCSHTGAYNTAKAGVYRCKSCKKDFTVRMGTVMHRSHIPLHKWLYAMYCMVTARKGISSLQLSKELGIRQASAWMLLHKLRESCSSKDALLGSVVEIDETYVGGKEKNKHSHKKLKAGRGGVGKQAVMGMRERNGDVVAFKIDNTTREMLHTHVYNNVFTGAVVYTDDFRSYIGLAADYTHETVCHSIGEFVRDMAHTMDRLDAMACGMFDKRVTYKSLVK
ncbi:IS1595 family transposase [Candidatus Enterovibrio escicola]|uniref:IS1595 family transposase n=1 Tax=Candidatus Enterovibrio escicola TaxID=1927127 RepID=UPI001237E1FC|nr:IS1595 family transposase [Candidatus Enterovibrio escacola]